jgi:AcrR family transcriptional regulator
MPPAKKKDLSSELISASLPLFAEKGTTLTMEEIAAKAGVDAAAARERFEDPVDILHEAYRRGYSQMERLLREPITGSLEDHMGVLFDGMMLSIDAFGPENYLGIVYRATGDRVLLEIVKRQSGKVNFAVKAFMVDMVTRSIIEEVEEVEKVNQELVASFVEHLAMLLEGKKLPAVRRSWVKKAAAMFRPCPMTAPSAMFE